MRSCLLAALTVLMSSCVSAQITDSQYIVVFDKLSCSGPCRLGDFQFGAVAFSDRSNQERSEIFQITGERDYQLNFGFRFDGPGVQYQLIFNDQNEQFARPLTLENVESVLFGGPQQRSFSRRFPNNDQETVFRLTYYVYRAAP